MCDCQEPNTVSSLTKQRGHISLISISSLTKLHCPDQSITEDDPKWDTGRKGQEKTLYAIYNRHVWMNPVLETGMCACTRVLISCLTRAGAAGNRWWNQPVAMETTASHRIPRTMECHNLRLIYPDTRQTWPHTTSAISEDHHQCTLPKVNVSCCETPCVNNLHRTLTKFQTSELLVLE